MASAPEDQDLVARDLAVFWHPCSQMHDYAVFPPLIVTGARGVRLRLEDGREVLDAISSWWCKALGHGHPRLSAALRAQQDAFEHVITANTTSASLVRFCERLLAAARSLRVPTMLVRGGISDVVSEETTEEFLAAVPHALPDEHS